ncbi:sigma-70 family RNA polymerase sigma factor [Streptomyces sp. BK340]|uniref:sigma-70 family RNA polymerase sigma factor n=1 Tax=Streptomyces sp. BK340 TaxID=2572903 RepID=UPI0011A82461|nr:sigma-70 family RNA polymerase sigma factor [Streptomyces sp. BK340]TVZ76760.1 RNA polymerase sigma-70 factor (ECF subfamily) [Streptomyces sp. BK340]
MQVRRSGDRASRGRTETAERRGGDQGRVSVQEADEAPPTERATLDEETLHELYRLHGSYLFRALLRLTSGDRGRAEDVLQETLVRAWQHPAAMSRGPEHARPWLFTVARRIAIDHFRMQAARPQETTDEVPEEYANVADPFDDVLVARDMEVVLAELAPHQREVLIELHMRDRSVAETAGILGVPVGTVKSRNFYAIRSLREALGVHDEALEA